MFKVSLQTVFNSRLVSALIFRRLEGILRSEFIWEVGHESTLFSVRGEGMEHRLSPSNTRVSTHQAHTCMIILMNTCWRVKYPYDCNIRLNFGGEGRSPTFRILPSFLAHQVLIRLTLLPNIRCNIVWHTSRVKNWFAVGLPTLHTEN